MKLARVRWLQRGRSLRDPFAAGGPVFDPSDFHPALRTRLLILQPTPFCNIDCDYCYLPERRSTARISMSTVRLAAERLRDDGLAGPELTVVWHAGEPLAMPKDFYAEAIETLREILGACKVTHSIQTNATLIDDEWCDLFNSCDVQIGVSLDGPASLHDAHRRTRSGHGTHARAMRGIERLRAHGIRFHAIAVVTPDTFRQVDDFMDFFEALGVSTLGCNFDEAEGVHKRSSLSGHEDAHAAFVARLLERSSAPGARLQVRELAMAYQLISQPLRTNAWRDLTFPDNAQTLPFELITVSHQGDFCTFSPELLGQPSAEFGNFLLGNVATTGYFESARSERFQRLWGAILQGTQTCKDTCAHFGFCGGGAPANKLYETGSLASGETLYCRTMIKRPFDAVLQQLERIRQAWASHIEEKVS